MPLWESTDQEFYFRNHLTDERISAKSRAPVWVRPSPPLIESPSELQKKEALAAALEAGYGTHVFSQLIRYNIDLNVHILDYDQTPEDIDIIPPYLATIPVSPLEWATEYQLVDLVELFLENGADANFTLSPQDGPALFKAVKKQPQRLVEILVQKSDRISCTRALALAVERQDITSAEILLAHGVGCDFEESDRPLPHNPMHGYSCSFGPGSGPLGAENFTPPLVRAARLGNVPLVRWLLEHGADANIAFHNLGGCGDQYQHRDSGIPAYFSCGRVVQLAMEKGYSEVVRLLVEAGADINLPHPIWPQQFWPLPGHICLSVPRAVYIKNKASLESIVAVAREGKAHS